MKNVLIVFGLLAPIGLCAQNRLNSTESIETVSKVDLGFENYCLKEAISYIEIVSVKSVDLSFSGEKTSLVLNTNATHLDYGIQLKEGETQYFKLKGSKKVLSVKSLFVLRLNYNNSTKSI